MGILMLLSLVLLSLMLLGLMLLTFLSCCSSVDTFWNSEVGDPTAPEQRADTNAYAVLQHQGTRQLSGSYTERGEHSPRAVSTVNSTVPRMNYCHHSNRCQWVPKGGKGGGVRLIDV